MHRNVWKTLGVVIVLSMVLALAAPSAFAADPKTASGASLSKIGPSLRPLAKAGGETLADVVVFVAAGTDLSAVMEKAIAPPPPPPPPPPARTSASRPSWAR